MFISGILIILVGYIFKEILLSLIVSFYGDDSNSSSELSYFIFTDVVEVFNVYVCLILFLGKQILFFQILYHVLIFFVPGITKSEYKQLLTFFFTMSGLFFLAIIVFKQFLFPFSWKFFLSFKDFVVFKSLTLHFEAKLLNYLTFFINFYFSCIISFQFFLIPFFFIFYFKKELSNY